jgi:hypothetical protein
MEGAMGGSGKTEKMDFTKSHKDLYSATRKIREVQADRAVFLSIKGTGEPGGPAFQDAIGKLYALAYTTKFMLKGEGKLDFAVCRLECLWHMQDPETLPRSEWPWQLIIRIPASITAAQLRKAGKQLSEKKDLDASAVERWAWREGRALQMMHLGPYDDLGITYNLLFSHAQERGLTPNCPTHEIYISDPRRVAPERLKTIVRLPVK